MNCAVLSGCIFKMCDVTILPCIIVSSGVGSNSSSGLVKFV